MDPQSLSRISGEQSPCLDLRPSDGRCAPVSTLEVHENPTGLIPTETGLGGLGGGEGKVDSWKHSLKT